MNAVIGNLMTGNFFGALTAMFDESPQENSREAAVDILDGKNVEQNLAKLQGELQRNGGDREKIAQVDELMQDMASGRADQTSTMEKILAIVGPKDAEKRGVAASNTASIAGKGSGVVEF